MHILLTNDDGIHAAGLWALHKALAGNHTVTVIAPDRERSAIGHAITLDRPLRVNKTTVNSSNTGYSVSGTPADCVKLGLLEILENPPHLVISGINPGANVGININYSGTVAAAREAAFNGIQAFAVSVEGHSIKTYDQIAVFAAELADMILEKPLPFGTFLNVNVPDIPIAGIAGIRISRQGIEQFNEYFEKRTDPRNRTYFWQGCDVQPVSDNPETDGCALKNRFISITPIKSDSTDYTVIERLTRSFSTLKNAGKENK